MSARPRLELLRPRDVGGILGDSFTTYFRHFGAFVAAGAAVVIPVELIVTGLGLGRLTAGYHDPHPVSTAVVSAASTYLVIGPLVTAMVVQLLQGAAGVGAIRTRAAIVSGLEAFAPMFYAVVLAAAGVVLGLVFFIVPGLYLAIRWYFVPQSVVVDGRRRTEALRRSAELVTGHWWRVLAIVIFAALVVGIPAGVIQVPFDAAARAADSAALALAGGMVSASLTTPFVTLMLTLLYFDLVARRSGVAPPSPQSPPPPPPRPEAPPDPPGLPPRDGS